MKLILSLLLSIICTFSFASSDIPNNQASQNQSTAGYFPIFTLGKKYTRRYSIAYQPHYMLCCPQIAPPVIHFPGFGGGSGANTTPTSSCSRVDSLDNFVMPIVAGGSCTLSNPIYDHYQCQCETQCNDAHWTCNGCPNIKENGLPLAAPDDFPQNSLRSRPEFIGESCTPCSGLSQCGGLHPPAPPPIH